MIRFRHLCASSTCTVDSSADFRCVAQWLIPALLFIACSVSSVFAQPVVVSATDDPALEQLPILFHHGFNDDGRAWAMNDDGGAADTPAQYWDRIEVRSPSNALLQRGIPTYVVQYWARSNRTGFIDGDPRANADEGWAAFKSPEDIRTPGRNYNSADPLKYFLDNAYMLLPSLPDCRFDDGLVCTYPATDFMWELYKRRIVSNYNRNGLVEHHAQNLSDLLSHVFYTDERFNGYRQVNMITHSAGGLDTRGALYLLNQSEYQGTRESVANTIYTAPPFGGSTAAVLASLFYAEDFNGDSFRNPWLQEVAGDMTLVEVFRSITRAFALPLAEAALDVAVDATPKPFGFDPTAVTIRHLMNHEGDAAVAAAFVIALRGLVSVITGFPGEPKVSEDLTPWGAVNNLNQYQPNYNTTQFVTWAGGGGRINLTPSLAAARSAYNLSGSCCNEFLDPQSLSRLVDDWAVSNVSSRMLTTSVGGMEELASYPDLWHGNIHTDMNVVGMDWVRTLISPVTGLELHGPVPTADDNLRFYRVGGTASVRFLPESRSVTDRFNRNALISASNVEYRLVTYNLQQDATYHDWVLVTPGATVNFSDLIDTYPEIAGESPFRLQWRAINGVGAREAIRSASFSVDATPPSVVLIDVFTPGFPDTPEIRGSGSVTPSSLIRRSDLLTDNFGLRHLPELLNKPETNWIIRNPSNKLLRIDFDEVGAIMRYQWDDFFTDPVVDSLLNVSKVFVLSDLSPGPHTLYFEVSDRAGNETNAVQSISILVDDQAPVVGLNYESTGGLDFVVGPETPIEFLAEDVETGIVRGSLIVPGMSPVPVNSNFRMGETSIADAASSTDVMGLIVTLQADVTDGVGNQTNQSFDVYYDFTPPRIELQHVDESLLTVEGIYRTTRASIRLELAVRDNAGIVPPTWTATRPGSNSVTGGYPFVYGTRGGRPSAYGSNVTLSDGLNIVTVTATDLVGNTSSMDVVIEKVQTLIEDESNRPIELLSLHVEGAPSSGTGAQNVATSDDGEVFIFDSSRSDHVIDDTNGLRDIFVWRNSSLMRANTNAEGRQAEGGASRNPALSGNGRYAFFSSEATNLVAEPVSGLNLYVKDLASGNVAVVSRDRSGNPINLNPIFGRLSFLQLGVTYSGRYVFFADRFDGYVEGDTNGNLDIFVADLDPDIDGDFFNTLPVIRRVSRALDGSEAVGGTNTGGSRYPSVSRDGLYLTFQTDHTNLFEGDTNDTRDAVLMRFGGVDADGTLDFNSFHTIPLAVDSQGRVTDWGSDRPMIDRTGRAVLFATASNLLASDTNNEGVDSDLYRSTGFLENWRNRVLTLESRNAGGSSVTGRIAPGHLPSMSDYPTDGQPRVAYLSDKASIVSGDANGKIDLFVNRSDGPEAINWLSSSIPSTSAVLKGGLTPNGMYAWWVTNENYSTIVGVGPGLDLYRRSIDPLSETEAPQIVTAPSDVTALVGSDVALTVAASGRPVPSYQWSFNGVEMPGAVNPVLLLSEIDFTDEGVYAVTVSNEAGSVMSGGAHVRVTSLIPAIVQQPTAVEAIEGSTAVLGVHVAGLEPLSFEWRRDGAELTTDDRFSGIRSDTLRIVNVELGDAGTYRLTASNAGGETTAEAVTLTVLSSTGADEVAGIPHEFALLQNYPNPFNPETVIRFGLPVQEHVRIEVFDVLGRRVSVLVDAMHPAGWHEVTLNAGSMASGTYFYMITAGSFKHARPLTLTR